ncbi:MAG: hypothetical protein LBB98_11295 [Treponema sp.]|nr:hypothetical protein [Treponema sp.]
MAALPLKDATDLVEQKVQMDRAVDSLLHSAPARNWKPWLEFNVAHRFCYGSFFTWRNTGSFLYGQDWIIRDCGMVADASFLSRSQQFSV